MTPKVQTDFKDRPTEESCSPQFAHQFTESPKSIMPGEFPKNEGISRANADGDKPDQNISMIVIGSVCCLIGSAFCLVGSAYCLAGCVLLLNWGSLTSE
jgi:hypothetical protein